MPPPDHHKNYQHLILPGIVAFGALWALGLFGFGLWQQSQQPTAESSPIPANTTSPDYSTFSQVKAVPSGRFKYSGSPDWSPIRLVVDSAIQSERREYQLSYIQPKEKKANTTTAIALLIDGKLDFVQSDRSLKPSEIAQAQKEGLQLQQTPVAIDGIAIAVHPSLSIEGLTLEQVADIYQGTITNWADVGGPNLAIQPLTLSFESEGILDQFLSQVMQGASFSKQVDYFSSMTAALRKLADSPGGIFFGSAADLVPQCSVKPLPIGKSSQAWTAPYQAPYVLPDACPNQRNQINIAALSKQQYPLTRQLYLIYANDGDKARAGKAYTQLLLTNQGQDLLNKAGFVQVSK